MAYNNITLEIYFRPSVIEVVEAGDTVILWVSKSARVCAPVKVDFTLVHYLHGLLRQLIAAPDDEFDAFTKTAPRSASAMALVAWPIWNYGESMSP